MTPEEFQAFLAEDPYSRREALTYMLGPGRAMSMRELADVLHWNYSKVQRFRRVLVDQGLLPMVDESPDDGREALVDTGVSMLLGGGNESPELLELALDDQRVTPIPETPYAGEWEVVTAAYPRRKGGQGWKDAKAKYEATRGRGATHAELLAAAKRYSRYCEREGNVGTSFVMQCQRFFGPGEHWREPWKERDKTTEKVMDKRRRPMSGGRL